MQKGKRFILKGLRDYKKVIYKIIEDLNCEEECFDIELILSESLTNAFIHGNKRDDNKEIYISYDYDGSQVKFEIQDCGSGINNTIVPTEISEASLLNNHGRGLFLIQCFADQVKINHNSLIIKKILKSDYSGGASE